MCGPTGNTENVVFHDGPESPKHGGPCPRQRRPTRRQRVSARGVSPPLSATARDTPSRRVSLSLPLPLPLPLCPTDQGNVDETTRETRTRRGERTDLRSPPPHPPLPIRSAPRPPTMGDANCCRFLEILLAIVLPPLGVFLRFGCCSVSHPHLPLLPRNLMLCRYSGPDPRRPGGSRIRRPRLARFERTRFGRRALRFEANGTRCLDSESPSSDDVLHLDLVPCPRRSASASFLRRATSC